MHYSDKMEFGKKLRLVEVLMSLKDLEVPDDLDSESSIEINHQDCTKSLFGHLLMQMETLVILTLLMKEN